MECSLDKDAKTNLLDEAIETILVLRRDGARIHSITNTVAQNFTANVLLACNTKPSMTANPDEVEAFTSRADALHINLGTLDAERILAIRNSISIANKLKIPVLLDPVMANVSQLRASFAEEIAERTTIIRGNEQEINVLGIEDPSSLCVVKTGEQDQVLHESTCITVDNGHPIMAKVIATGCALGALITALSSKTDCPITASVAGLLWFGIAGEISAENSNGPGSFSPMFIDALYDVELDVLRDKAKLS
jgi:hydroxyethylthiazole kinase